MTENQNCVIFGIRYQIQPNTYSPLNSAKLGCSSEVTLSPPIPAQCRFFFFTFTRMESQLPALPVPKLLSEMT